MSRQSPGYPHQSLPKVIALVRKIYDQDRKNPIAREVAAQHIGYSGLNGAADKALATIGHYGLLERAGKGEVRVSQLAVDILYPQDDVQKRRAIHDAAFSPTIFKELNERFPDHTPSEGALRSHLMREEFLERAINPLTKSFLETMRYLEQENAIESGGPSGENDAESVTSNDDADEGASYGGAKVGDHVQWDSNGALAFERPKRVRHVSQDGAWVFVEGSETGVPMSEIIVQQSAPAVEPPKFPLDPAKLPDGRLNSDLDRSPDVPANLADGERQLTSGLLSKNAQYRVFVTGKVGPKEIDILIKKLSVDKELLANEDGDT